MNELAQKIKADYDQRIDLLVRGAVVRHVAAVQQQ
jgi:hypothetical protein